MVDLFDKNLLLRAGFKLTHRPCEADITAEDEYEFTAPPLHETKVILFKVFDKKTNEVLHEYVYVEICDGEMSGILPSCKTPEQLEALVFAFFNLKISLQ